LDAADGSPTDAVFVDNTGNVGIGTTSPSHKLHVYGDESDMDGLQVYNLSGKSRIRFAAGQVSNKQDVYIDIDDGGSHWYLGADASDGDKFKMASHPAGETDPFLSNVQMTVDTTGNVGIGTTSPSEKLNVSGNIRIDSNDNGAYRASGMSPGIWLNETNEAQKSLLIHFDDALLSFGRYPSNFNPSVEATPIKFDMTAPDDSLVMASSGNVGIGTTSPGAKLDVQGTVRVGQDTGSDGYDVNFYGTRGGFTGSRMFWDASKSAFRAGRDGDVTYWNDGNVGEYSFAVGYKTKASASYAVAMGDTNTADGVASTALGSDTTVTGDYSLAVGQYVTAGPAAHTIVLGQGAGSGADQLVNNTASSLMVGFNSDIPTLFVGPSAGTGTTGNVGIGTTSPSEKLHVFGNILATGTITPGSSRTLKDNIRNLEAHEALATLLRLNPTKFYYKADHSDEQLGFIAEDVPELVATKDRMGVAPMDIVAVLTKVVQQQQGVIETQQSEIKALRQKNKAHDESIREIKAVLGL